MDYFIQQNIQINIIRIGSIGNSSVMQIGSAGLIKPTSHLYNTGGFTKPAPEAEKPEEQFAEENSYIGMPSVPIAPISGRS